MKREKPVFTGAGTAIVTPFKNDEVDYDALGKLIDNQIAAGIDSIVVCGTTGEASTLTDEEHRDVIKFTVEKVGSRYRVQITGIGAHELGTLFTMTTGDTTISASAMTYVQQSLANGNASEATKNAAAALYEYYQQAINFGN